PAKKEFRQAAVAYFFIKLAIIFLVYDYVSCAGCQDTQFIRHTVHLVLFTHFIWAGMRITSTVIGAISVVRGTAYMINFFFNTGYLLHLPITGSSLILLHENSAGNWVFVVNALLMFAISAMVFRAVKAARKTSAQTSMPVPVGDVMEEKESAYGHSV
ncbi:MAG: hypothetical protein V3S46_07170, partial [Nitrospinota bacterium]